MRHPALQGMYFIEGKWRYEIRAPEGKLRKSAWIRNGVTDAALNDLQEVLFRAGTQRPNWYASLIASSGFTAVAGSDTMSSHSGWTEMTGYNESSRPAWTPSAAAEGRLINAGAMTFTMTAAVTLEGLFLTSSSLKAGTAGLLWSTGLFDAPESLLQGEVMRLFYDLQAAPGAG